jgi:hypothetical protein
MDFASLFQMGRGIARGERVEITVPEGILGGVNLDTTSDSLTRVAA